MGAGSFGSEAVVTTAKDRKDGPGLGALPVGLVAVGSSRHYVGSSTARDEVSRLHSSFLSRAAAGCDGLGPRSGAAPSCGRQSQLAPQLT